MKKKKFNRNEYFSESELYERRWTDKLIKSLLPAPISKRISASTREKYYHKADVYAMEETFEFYKLVKEPSERELRKQSLHERQVADMQEYFYGAHEVCRNIYAETRAEKILMDYMHRSMIHSFGLPSYDVSTKEASLKNIEEIFRNLKNAMPSKDKESLHLMRKTRYLISMLFKNRSHAAKEYLYSFMDEYGNILLRLARQQIETMDSKTTSGTIEDFLMMTDFPYGELMNKSLYQLYLIYYIPYSIQKDLKSLVKVNPKDEYPAARSMDRKFFIHVGPTNSGKTYGSLQRLSAAKTGTYLGPLRLLALEVQEKMLEKNVVCSLLTGEEEDFLQDATHVSSTVEKADLDTHFQVAVIDECQIIKDPQRGFAWTRAILGLQADEIHCCVAPEGLEIVKALISDCGEEYKIISTQRFTELQFEKKPVSSVNDIQPGDAIVAFSKKQVLRIAEFLQENGKAASVIYGDLPYPARKLQIERFLSGETQYVVATDAIGMGLNLPIRRILFFDIEKYDGMCVRTLLPEEVRQIAGRAGRKGLYDYGFVGAVQFGDDHWYYNIPKIKTLYNTPVIYTSQAQLGFTNLIMRIDYDTLEILKAWKQLPVESPLYSKMDISRYIEIISMIRSEGFQFSKETELKCAGVMFDERNESLTMQFLEYCRCFKNGEPIVAPVKKSGSADSLELYCKKLDLYYSFSKNFGFPVDSEWLKTEKMNASRKIHQYLVSGITSCSVIYAKNRKNRAKHSQKQKYRNKHNVKNHGKHRRY